MVIFFPLFWPLVVFERLWGEKQKQLEDEASSNSQNFYFPALSFIVVFLFIVLWSFQFEL